MRKAMNGALPAARAETVEASTTGLIALLAGAAVR